MKKYFTITISRVLSFIGEILNKIRPGVLEKSRILQKESILPHSNGIYYSNSHVHLWTFVMKRIRPNHCLNTRKNILFINKILFRKATTKKWQQQIKHLGFDHAYMYWWSGNNHTGRIPIEEISKTVNEIGTSLIKSGRRKTLNLTSCCYKRITLASSAQKKLNKLCLSIHNILCDLLLTVVQVSSTLINIKPNLCFINMMNMGYCGKSHWNGVILSLLTKF